ncbi:hypothetical protein F-LCD7_0223 [Faustovirus]|nr:hypothetical protein F-LCD7_0223 [Faustovirus]
MANGRRSNMSSFNLARYQQPVDPDNADTIAANAIINGHHDDDNDINGCCATICGCSCCATTCCGGVAIRDIIASIARVGLIVGMLALCVLFIYAGVASFKHDNETGVSDVWNATNMYAPDGTLNPEANAYLGLVSVRIIIMVGCGLIGIVCIVVLAKIAKLCLCPDCCNKRKYQYYTEV